MVSLGASLEFRFRAVMGTILECCGMPDLRLMWAEEVQSKREQSEAARGLFLTPTFNLLFFDSRAMDVIGRAATLYRK